MAKKEEKLHYDKSKLIAEYEKTFRLMMWAGAIVIGLGLVYMFAMIIYLGGWSHTKYEPFVGHFGDRIEIDYDGLKHPVHGEGFEKTEKHH